MSTPFQLIDPNTGVEGPPQGLLSPAERAAIGQSVDPAMAVQEYRQNREQQQDWLDKAELDRIKLENEQMRAQLGQATAQIQDQATSTAQLQGQLHQLTQSQLAAQQAEQAQARFALTEEELANHAEVLPLAEKIAARQTHELETRLRAEYEQKLAERTQQATAPLQESIAQTQEQLAAQQRHQASVFNADLASRIQEMGLPDITSITRMPEFQTWFNENLAPGVIEAKGDRLKKNITEQNLFGALEMLKDFRDNHTNYAANDTETGGVPASQAPRVPQTDAQHQNMTRREQLTKILQNRQEDFVRGVIPNGWTLPKYRVEQQKLRDEIAAIPIN